MTHPPSPGHATIHAARSFAHPPATVFHHWIDPTARRRWEASEETGMRYDAFDTRPGGLVPVRVFHKGKEVGQMLQRIHVVAEGAGRARLSALATVMDLTGADPRLEHEKGWTWILGRFAADLDEHGPSPH